MEPPIQQSRDFRIGAEPVKEDTARHAEAEWRCHFIERNRQFATNGDDVSKSNVDCKSRKRRHVFPATGAIVQLGDQPARVLRTSTQSKPESQHADEDWRT